MKYYLLIIAFTSLLSACGKRSPTNVETGTANQILHIGNSEEPREIDPQLSTGSPESNIHLALYEGLTRKHPKTLEPTPGIAESWTISDDQRIYTFTLRKDALWSNGDHITADHIVWSFKRSLMPNLASEWAYMKYYIKNAEEFNTGKITNFSEVGVRTLDEHTVQFELNYPVDFFLQLLSHASYFPVHPPTILAHGPIDQAISLWTRPKNWVGNGPFTLKTWTLNERIETTKNPNYWDADNVLLNGVVFYPITDQQAEVRAFRSGQIHLSYSPTMAIEKVAHYKTNEPESLRIHPTYATYYYEFNTTKPPFDDVRVRRALSLAVDRKAIVERVSKSGEQPGYSLIPDDPDGFSPTQQFSYDIDKAKILLADAGYPNGEGFPAVDILYNSQDNHRKIALAIQQMLAVNLNIQVGLLNQEWKVYLNSRTNLEHDIARAGWISDYLDPSNFVEILLSNSGNNNTGWASSEYDTIIAELKKTSDREERFALFERANKILSDEMPVIPIYLYSDVNLVSTEVKGWYDNVMHTHPYNRVYLEKAEK